MSHSKIFVILLFLVSFQHSIQADTEPEEIYFNYQKTFNLTGDKYYTIKYSEMIAEIMPHFDNPTVYPEKGCLWFL